MCKAQLFSATNNLAQMLFVAENSMYSSYDQGNSWQSVGGNLGEVWSSVTSDATGQHWYGVSTTGLLVSSNGGSKWSKSFTFETMAISSNYCGNIASDGSGQYVLGGITVLKHGSNGFVYYSCSLAQSSNYGKSWAIIDVKTTYLSGSFSGDMFAMLSGNTSVVYLSTDFGSTWTKSGVARYNAKAVTLQQVSFQFNNNSIIALGIYEAGSTYSTVICRLAPPDMDFTCSLVCTNYVYNVYIQPFFGQSMSMMDYNGKLMISNDFGYSFYSVDGVNFYKKSSTNVVVGTFHGVNQSSYFSLNNSKLIVYTDRDTSNAIELKYTCQPGFVVLDLDSGECEQYGDPCDRRTDDDSGVPNAYNDGTSLELSKKCSNFPIFVPNKDVSGCYRFCEYPYKQLTNTLSCHDYHHGSGCDIINLQLPKFYQWLIIGIFAALYVVSAVYVVFLSKLKSCFWIFGILFAYGMDTTLTYMDTFTDLLFITSNDFAKDYLFYLSVVFYLIHPFFAACGDFVRNFRGFALFRYSCEDATNLLLFAVQIILFIINIVILVPWFILLMFAHSTRLIAIRPVGHVLRPVDGYSYQSLYELPMSPNVLASEKAFGYLFESIPQLILNVFNAYMLNRIDTFALISMACSVAMLLNGIYSSMHKCCYHRENTSYVNSLLESLNDREFDRKLLSIADNA